MPQNTDEIIPNYEGIIPNMIVQSPSILICCINLFFECVINWSTVFKYMNVKLSRQLLYNYGEIMMMMSITFPQNNRLNLCYGHFSFKVRFRWLSAETAYANTRASNLTQASYGSSCCTCHPSFALIAQ